MTDELRFRLERNEARRQRREKFAGFVEELDKRVEFSPASIEYASFEETREALERIRAVAGSYPPGDGWRTYERAALEKRLHLLADRLPDTDALVFLYVHYLFLGALRIPLRVALKSVGAFLDVGEESILLSDVQCSNHLDVDASEDLGGNLEYTIGIGGDTWPTATSS